MTGNDGLPPLPCATPRSSSCFEGSFKCFVFAGQAATATGRHCNWELAATMKRRKKRSYCRAVAGQHS